MAVTNVTYNIGVKSKFSLFLDDDLCDAEPEELVRRVCEDKKKREKEIKEAKRKEKQVKTKTGCVQIKEEKVVKGGNEGTVKRLDAGPISSNTFKREVKVTEVAEKMQNKAEGGHKHTEKTYVKTENSPKVHSKIDTAQKSHSKTDTSFNDEETSDDKNKSNKNKRALNNAPKTRGREFDRHSGSDKTGIKTVERKDGSGSYNWGNVMDIVELPTFSEQKDVTEEKVIANTIEAGEMKEPEKPVMTISEWKALHINDNLISSHVSTRPANNGENVFTGMNAYQKKNIHQNESDNEVIITEDDADSKGRRQIKVNIEFSGRVRRGGRGGFSNPRFKKDDANQESNKDGVINLDEEEFPTLS